MRRKMNRSSGTPRQHVGETAKIVASEWMKQIVRNLTDINDGFLNGVRYLIHDREPWFTEEFREILNPSGATTVKLPPRCPNPNAYAERSVRSVKSECLAKIIPLGERHLRKAVKEYTEYDHLERNFGSRRRFKSQFGLTWESEFV